MVYRTRDFTAAETITILTNPKRREMYSRKAGWQQMRMFLWWSLKRRQTWILGFDFYFQMKQEGCDKAVDI